MFVAIAIGLGLLVFLGVGVQHPFMALVFVVLGSAFLGGLGIIAGVFANKFDQMAAITNFIVTPLAMLSGTFYSVTQLPDFAFQVTQYNPFFYMIDGFRYALTGHAEGSLLFGASFLLALTLISSLACQYVLSKGWRIKS